MFLIGKQDFPTWILFWRLSSDGQVLMEARKLVSGRLGAQLLRCGKQQGRPKFTATTAPPAHLVYDQLPDKATLLLVAQSAASSNYKDQVFWQNCSSQARRLCQDDLHALACYAATAASAQHQDDELLHFGFLQGLCKGSNFVFQHCLAQTCSIG